MLQTCRIPRYMMVPCVFELRTIFSEALAASIISKAVGEIGHWRKKLSRSYAVGYSAVVLVSVHLSFSPAVTGLFVYLEVGDSSETFDEHSQRIRTENRVSIRLIAVNSGYCRSLNSHELPTALCVSSSRNLRQALD